MPNDQPLSIREIAGAETIERMRQVLVEQVGPAVVRLIVDDKLDEAVRNLRDVHAVVRLFDMTTADLDQTEETERG